MYISGWDLFKGDGVARHTVNGLEGIARKHVRLQGAPFGNVQDFDSRGVAGFVEHDMHTNTCYLIVRFHRPIADDRPASRSHNLSP